MKKPAPSHHQEYLVEEFAEDYLARRLGRRDLLRRVLLITGSIPLTAGALVALGCGGNSEPEPDPEATATLVPPQATVPSTTGGVGPGVSQTDPDIVLADVRFAGAASEILAYLARPKAAGTYPGVAVIHENRGLVGHIKDVARRYAKEGFVALAVDLVSRGGGSTADLAANTGFLGRAAPEDLVADLEAGLAYLKAQPFVLASALGVTGFCFGGSYTWELAIASSEIKAAVPYYGTVRLVDELAKTEAAILAVYGGSDARVTGQRSEVEQSLQAAAKTFEIKVYDGAGHAFFNDTGGRYDAEAAADAWQSTLAWFRRYLSV